MADIIDLEQERIKRTDILSLNDPCSSCPEKDFCRKTCETAKIYWLRISKQIFKE